MVEPKEVKGDFFFEAVFDENIEADSDDNALFGMSGEDLAQRDNDNS